MSFKNIFSLLVVFSFVFSFSFVSAQEEIPVDSKSPSNVLIADIDLYNARVLSQEGNSFSVSFDLRNNYDSQSGIKYGVKVVSLDGKLIDEKVFDESISLSKGEYINKTVSYTAPSQFGGEYNLFINLQTESGIPLGQALVGKYKLTQAQEYIYVPSESCTVNKKSINVSMVIDYKDSLILSCTLNNNTEKELSVFPHFETRYNSIYGGVAEQKGGNYDQIKLLRGEKKAFSIELPKGISSKSYVVTLKFITEGYTSNPINVSYTTSGATASVYEASLDKDYYRARETATLSLVWFSKGTRVYLEAEVLDSKGDSCADTVNTELVKSYYSPETQVSILIDKSCLNPEVSILLKDDAGRILDQKTFEFKTGQEGINVYKKDALKGKIIAGVAALLLIVIIIIKRKKKVA